ncbi:DUF2786 domain-containing protein [Rhodococcus spongiicola]|uniref:DUF2786 domain-containing protein n=1 Tax=Rhodococcus spongiicola TaxID=2487352 RepID=A0A3S3AJR2_9NOCA|nr:DUF2786 domain-containing protein [Rhodococcus spongiicola]RVW06308.1 DUF2786 domain-containing protein [Rhodococcus spongiicola]
MGRNRTYFRTGDRLTDVPPRHRSAAGLITALAGAYERGWQPADIMHVTRRALGTRTAPTAAAALLFEARASQTEALAPQDWRMQLSRIADAEPDAARFAEGLPARCEPDDFATALDAVDWQIGVREWVDLTALWLEFPRLNRLCEPPSAWPDVRVQHHAPDAKATDHRALSRIRRLLAKAEATEFVEEAETLTAKAQDLMTRYAISAALLDSVDNNGVDPVSLAVRSHRIHLDNPYVREKVHLLTAIGEANRVRTVWFDRFAIATVVGSPVDLEQVDLLFTSLLVQATRAMHAAGADERGTSRTGAFRKAFLFGFAVRIGQRLKETDSRATAEAAVDANVRIDDLLPVLAMRSAAVDAEFDRLFPATRASVSRSVDADGWFAGQSAADRASVAAGERRITR